MSTQHDPAKNITGRRVSRAEVVREIFGISHSLGFRDLRKVSEAGRGDLENIFEAEERAISVAGRRRKYFRSGRKGDLWTSVFSEAEEWDISGMYENLGSERSLEYPRSWGDGDLWNFSQAGERRRSLEYLRS